MGAVRVGTDADAAAIVAPVAAAVSVRENLEVAYAMLISGPASTGLLALRCRRFQKSRIKCRGSLKPYCSTAQVYRTSSRHRKKQTNNVLRIATQNAHFFTVFLTDASCNLERGFRDGDIVICLLDTLNF